MYSTLIHSACVVDGTGNPWFHADVALAGEQIAAIAPPNSIAHENAANVIDGSGMVLCPGFIDILSHSIIPLMADGRCLSKIKQGVTTEIMGEGWTPAPQGGKIEQDILRRAAKAYNIEEWAQRAQGWSRFRHWLEAMTDRGVSSNIGSFLGGGTLRSYAKGMAMGPANEDELATMRRVMAEAMEDGAMGVSQALIYPPSAYVDTDELVETARVVGEHNGLYITHIRSEADDILNALEEAIEVGQRANVPVQIYHLKAAGQRNWHKMDAVIERITQARAEGVDITADMYPYPAMGTGLSSILPPWAAADGKFFDNLRDPETRERIRHATLDPSGDWEAIADLCGPENVMPVGFEKAENQPYVAKRLTEIAEMMGVHWFDAAVELFLSEEQRIATIYFSMSDEQVKQKLQQPWLMIGTDAGGMDPAWASELGPIHPRGHEGVGYVVKVGRDVKGINEGDRVAGGGFATLRNLAAERIYKIPESQLPDEYWVVEPVSCAVTGIDHCRLRAGDRVAVIGAGFMGLLILQGLRHSPLEQLVAVDVVQSRLDLASSLGIGETFNAAEMDKAQLVEELKARDFDVVVDTSGNQAGLDLATDIVKRGGLINLFGWLKGETATFHPTKWHTGGFTIVNSSPSSRMRDPFPPAIRLIHQGLIDLRPLVTHVRPLAQYPALMDGILHGDTSYIKGVITLG